MKKILRNALLKTLFMAVFALTLSTLSATPAATLRIEKVSTGYKQVSVELAGFAGPVSLMLKSEKQEILVNESVPVGAAFAKIFNLSQLPAGRYELHVGSETKDVVQPLTVTEADVILTEGQRREFFAPTALLRGRNLDFNWFSSRIVGQVEVVILDDNGVPFFKDAVKNVFRVERRYRLEHLPRGQYTLRFTTPHKTYYQSIALN
jgi:cell division protein YceG involved in septum cleavage